MFARLVVVIAVLAAAPARAETCDPAEAAALREHLEAQSETADHWNLAWRIIFTTSAVGSATVGYLNPFPSQQVGLYTAAAKSSLGAISRWVMPLRVHVPAASPSGDTCADLAALRTELARVAKKERTLFWMTHVGGLLVNLAGSAYVWYADKPAHAVLGFTVGYPVGLLSIYTMPRGAWHRYRERTWTSATVSVVPHGDGWVLGVSGAF